MSGQTVTVTIPSALFTHLERRAKAENRSVQDEIVEMLLAVAPIPEAYPATNRDFLSQMTLLSDAELWQSAASRLTNEEAAELEALHHKRDREGLSADEECSVAGLMRRYERAMLIRAQAAALLKQRGHDVSVLVKRP